MFFTSRIVRDDSVFSLHGRFRFGVWDMELEWLVSGVGCRVCGFVVGVLGEGVWGLKFW